MTSPLDASRRTCQSTSPSSTSSSAPVTVTVRAVSQFCTVNTSDDGATRPSVASRLVTDTVTAAEGCVCSATVNVAVPPPSVTGPLAALSSNPNSSSRMVSVALDGAATPRPPAAAADTVTRFRPEATMLSTAVIVTRPALVVEPAAIVSVFVLDCIKSPDTAFSPAAAATVKVAASVVGCDSRAVTVEMPPFSRIEAGFSTSVAAAASSSVIVTSSAPGAAMPLPPVVVPETVTVLVAVPMSTLLSTAVTVTAPVLVVAPAAMVSIVPVCVKSPATAPDDPSGAVATVTVAAALDGPDSVAVTVAMPPFSEIGVGDTTSDTVGSVSSSVSVSAAPVTAPAPWPFAKVAVTVALRPAVPWWIWSFTAVTSAVSDAAVVDPAAMTMVASAPAA